MKSSDIDSGACLGARYERLVILAIIKGGRRPRALCRCDCGVEKEIRLDGLKSGKVKSCGCWAREQRHQAKPALHKEFSDILQHRFGRLLATGLLRETGKTTKIVCRCDCGAQALVTAPRLRAGDTISCGCYYREQQIRRGEKTRVHGHTVDGPLASGMTSIYRAWLKIRQLCKDVQRRGFSVVNGTYDLRWETFEGFLDDWGEIGWAETVIRKDQALPWSKKNCYIGKGPMDGRRKSRTENAQTTSLSKEIGNDKE